MFQGWLARSMLLQRQFHPHGLPMEEDSEWRAYVEYNVVALIKELGELLAEVQTSPWKKVGVVSRMKAWEEYVDVMHFLANIGLAIGLDDNNLTVEYERKMNENYERLLSGRSKPIATLETCEPYARGTDTHPVYGREARGNE